MKRVKSFEDISNYAKEIRKHHKLTIKEISENMNFSHVYIGRFENGKFKKNIEQMIEYLNLLGINIYIESIEIEKDKNREN